MAIAFDVSTVATAYTSTGTQTTSHAAGATARAAVVLIDQNASTADQVSGVTYGGLPMTRLRSDTESTETGRTYIYWLDDIPHGTQSVAMTTTGTANKQLVVATMTVAVMKQVAVAGSATGTSASAANPSWSITGLTSTSVLEAFEVIHSGLDTMTTTPASGWTLVSSTDLGTQGRGFARQHVASSGTSLTSGWAASTADDYVGSSVAFIESTYVAPTPWAVWDFNAGSGTTAADTTGHGHTLNAASSTASWTAASRHGAGAAVGLGTDAASFTLPASSGSLTTWSFTAWAKVGSGLVQSMLMDLTHSRGLYLYGGQAVLDPLLGGAGEVAATYTASVGEWVHVGVVVQPGLQRLYINGALSASGTNATFPLDLTAAQDICGTVTASNTQTLTMDDVRLYDTAIQARQVVWDMAVYPGQTPSAAHFLTSVSADGRYMLDEVGNPILATLESGWGAFASQKSYNWEPFLADRQARGFNGFYCYHLYDGVTPIASGNAPFVGGSIATPNEPWWAEFDAFLSLAETYGQTVIPEIVATWPGYTACRTLWTNATDAQAYAFGQWLANRYKTRPNLIWLIGGDWDDFPHDATLVSRVTHLIDGLRANGDTHLVGIHETSTGVGLGDATLATYSSFAWAYSYRPTYFRVRQGYAFSPTKITWLIEANYEREDNEQTAYPTTDETIRRQMLWTLTSGGSGHAHGDHTIFPFTPDAPNSNWRMFLNTTATQQLTALNAWWRTLAWHTLVPDLSNTLITSGLGTQRTTEVSEDVLSNDYATAAISADRSLAVCYIPTSRAFTLDLTKVGSSPTVTAIDPTTMATTNLGTSGSYSALGTNAGGTGDWIVQITATATGGATLSGTIAATAGTAGALVPSAAAGVVAGTAGTAGTLTRAAAAGTVAVASTIAGTLPLAPSAGVVAIASTVAGAVPRSTVAGAAPVVAGVAGTVGISALAGTVAVVSTTAGGVPISTVGGVAGSTSTSSGTVARGTVGGSTAAAASTVGTVGRSAVAGTVGAVAGAAGLVGISTASGVVDVVSAVTGTVVAAPIVGIAGSVAVTSATAGTVARSLTAGSTAAQASTTGTLARSQVAGAIDALTALVGTLSGPQTGGTVAVVTTVAGVLTLSLIAGTVTVAAHVAGSVAVPVVPDVTGPGQTVRAVQGQVAIVVVQDDCRISAVSDAVRIRAHG